jgi:hypothetical protein
VAELLKNGIPSLVNALNEMIQQVWIGETLPESRTEWTRRAINLIASLVQHNQAGFESDKSTIDQQFSLRQILEKSNEFNITTHHLFIDYKAAYDTITRNEIYVIMAELDFPNQTNKINQ